MAGQKVTLGESTPEEIALANAAKPATAEEAVQRGKDEYRWVAKEQIFVGTALAYDVGHLVPDSNVQLHGYADAGQVEKYGSKGHDEIRAQLGLPPLPKD